MVTATMEQSEEHLKALQTLRDIRRLATKNFQDGLHSVTLVLSRPTPPEGLNVMLCGTHGPRGELISCQQIDRVWRIVARFRCDAVLKFCGKAERALSALEGAQ